MKKFKVEILKDNDIGLRKGSIKTLSPGIAKSLIKDGIAKKLEEIDVLSKKQLNSETLISEIKNLKESFTKLEERVAKSEESFTKLEEVLSKKDAKKTVPNKTEDTKASEKEKGEK